MANSRTRFGPWTAIAVVIANMVGTGVFTSLGYQLLDIQSIWSIMLLWLLGGLIAFSGALSYAELGASLPRSGGEYHFLRKIYHPMVGFVAGWVSATVGFAAPTALAAITFATYLKAIWPTLPLNILASLLVVLVALAHVHSRQGSSRFQVLFTGAKILLILIFCGYGLWHGNTGDLSFAWPETGLSGDVFSAGFAVALIYVSYAYTGWNAATYLTSELENPSRHLPRVLAGGTLVVSLLYLGLNFIFMYAAPVSALAGKVEVGYVAAQYMFGDLGANLMGGMLAMLLVSTVSAMTLAGPRVLQVLGEDYSRLSWLATKTKAGIPRRAIGFQLGLTILFIWTATFETILLFTGFLLALNTLATVLGLFVLRRQQPHLPRPYKAWGYPWTPLIFLFLTGWTLIYAAFRQPMEALVTLMVIGVAIAGYYTVKDS